MASDVVGKLFARVIQERSQCGFCKGRCCFDIIFVDRQLLEETCEHDELLFTLFVDLHKAYDLVLRAALWQVFGVPPQMLQII